MTHVKQKGSLFLLNLQHVRQSGAWRCCKQHLHFLNMFTCINAFGGIHACLVFMAKDVLTASLEAFGQSSTQQSLCGRPLPPPPRPEPHWLTTVGPGAVRGTLGCEVARAAMGHRRRHPAAWGRPCPVKLIDYNEATKERTPKNRRLDGSFSRKICFTTKLKGSQGRYTFLVSRVSPKIR